MTVKAKTMPEEGIKPLEELTQFIYHAATLWQSYWSLDSQDAHLRHAATFKRHEWWYLTTREAYFSGAILEIAKFFETNNSSVNVEYLLNILDRDPNWTPEVQAARSLLSERHPASADITFIRHNHYAHRSKKLTYRQMFERTSLAYDDVRNLPEKMAAILNVVVRSLQGSEVHPTSIRQRTEKELELFLNALDGPPVRPRHDGE